jgi:hypothetical protein
MKHSKEEIHQRLKLVPDELGECLASMENMAIFRDIANKNGLGNDEIREMTGEFTMVILGLTKLEDYGSELKKRLPAVPEEKVGAIAKEVNEKILKPVREVLLRAYNGPLDADTENEFLAQKIREGKPFKNSKELIAELTNIVTR